MQFQSFLLFHKNLSLVVREPNSETCLNLIFAALLFEKDFLSSEVIQLLLNATVTFSQGDAAGLLKMHLTPGLLDFSTIYLIASCDRCHADAEAMY